MGVTRQVSADVTPAQTRTTAQYAIWNYLYENSDNPTCISGGAVISMPILSNGSMCLSGSTTKVLNNLEVNGNLTTSGNAMIGSVSSPISRLEITGTCAVNAPAKPPGTTPCDGSHNSTFAITVGQTLDTTPTMPTVNFAGAYTAQALSTQTGCNVGGKNLFDNDTTLNNSDSANISSLLFGNTDYDCLAGANEIKWNHTTKTLTANGTFYFDGTYTSPSIGAVVYNGLASFYFTGGFVLSSSGSSVCGISGCGTNWDTAHNVLFVVAECWQDATGSHLLTSGCVTLSGGTTDQIGIYLTTNYTLSGGSGNMAPVICDTWKISGGSDILVPIKDFPPGTPAPTTSVSYAGTPPTGWSG
jgi:hypothetical protein